MEDDRRAAILQAVVQQYIQTSQPVSSSHVVSAGQISASSATVRSEMAALEREGFLQQPHTSAGRIPTDLGYRFFVDRLNGPAKLGPAQRQDIQTFFDKASGEIEQMLNETGRLLSGLTGSAAVVVAEHPETTTIRSVQLVTLGSRTALVVVVLSDGNIEKRRIALEEGTSDVVISSASTHLFKQLDGQVLAAAKITQPSGDALVDQLCEAALQALQQGRDVDMTEQVFVGGASQLAAKFEALETVRNVLSVLEQQFVVVNLIRNLLDRGVTVSIGGEHNVLPLAHCSLVVAPTMIGGEQRGSIAILGPTRMDYGQAMAAVSMVSESLSERLSEGGR